MYEAGDTVEIDLSELFEFCGGDRILPNVALRDDPDGGQWWRYLDDDNSTGSWCLYTYDLYDGDDPDPDDTVARESAALRSIAGYGIIPALHDGDRCGIIAVMDGEYGDMYLLRSGSTPYQEDGYQPDVLLTEAEMEACATIVA